MTEKFCSILTSQDVTASCCPNQPITNAGGVGYIKNNLGYIYRSDLSAQVQNDYESLWIEIQNDTKRAQHHLWGYLYAPQW